MVNLGFRKPVINLPIDPDRAAGLIAGVRADGGVRWVPVIQVR